MTRLQICKECKHSTKMGRLVACGQFLVGSNIVEEVDGKMQQVNLCGCIMNVKSKLKSAQCPLKRW